MKQELQIENKFVETQKTFEDNLLKAQDDVKKAQDAQKLL